MQGKVLLIELEGCNPGEINSKEHVLGALERITEGCGLTPIETISHSFRPQGISAITMVKESHVAIHSWPEHRYLSILIYSCGEQDPSDAVPAVRELFTHTIMKDRSLE
jgi:S-adenosylmethionine decarboxylase